MKRNRVVIVLSVLLSLAWSYNLFAQETPPPSGSPVDMKKAADDLAANQRILREGSLKDAVSQQMTAKALLSQKKTSEAIVALEKALEMVPEGMKADTVAQSIRADLADVYAKMADDKGEEIFKLPLAQRNWDEAIKDAKKALEFNPQDKNIRELLAALEREKSHPTIMGPQRDVRPDETPQRREDRVVLADKLREARIQIEAGYLDEAQKTLDDILLKDKYNVAAMHYLREVYDKRLAFDEIRYKAVSRKYLEDIDRRWWVKPPEKVQVRTLEKAGTISSIPAREKITNKLNTIEIAEVNFRDADLTTVIDFLSEESKRFDPENVGINIILKEAREGIKIRSLRMRNVKLIDVLKTIAELVDLRYVVEPNVVVFVKKDSDYGTRFETRVYPVDPTLMIKVTGGAGAEAPNLGGAAPPIGGDTGVAPGAPIHGAGGGEAVAIDAAGLIKMFNDLGVAFPPGSQAKYLPNLSRLVVTNTPENLESLENLLNELNVGQNQVEIETRFLDISENSLKEFGFEWFLGQLPLSSGQKYVVNPGDTAWPSRTAYSQGTDSTTGQATQTSTTLFGNPFTSATTNAFTGGLRDLSVISIGAVESLLGGSQSVINDRVISLAGVLTNPQFQVIVKALSRSGRSDLLSAPRVTTILGQPATIKIVTEFIYPNRFREPQAVAASGSSNGTGGSSGAVAVTPSTPISFATREIGVLLTVTPVLGADGYTINLSLNPEVSEFLGFINYGGKIQIPASGTALGYVEVDNKITQPIFATRSVITNVAIWDGQTVVLGGLAREDVSEFNDKVPMLGDIPFIGRLFRSKGKSVGKRNLIVFVTATLIDPAGNRVHPEGSSLPTFGAVPEPPKSPANP